MARTTRSQARASAQTNAIASESTAVEKKTPEGSEAGASSDEVQSGGSAQTASKTNIPEPARKRARGSGVQKAKNGLSAVGTSKAGSGKGKSRRRNLSLLPEMPFDVLHETIMYLEPKDLLNMARANKDFRRMLIHPSMSGLWKLKRKEMGAPDPPPSVSEAKWLTFLVSTFCYSCGAPRALIEFQLFRRLCISCKKAHYVAGANFSKTHPDIDSAILEYVPYTNSGAWAKGSMSSGKFYWDDDVLQVEKDIDLLQADIDSKKPGAKAAMKAFKEERTEWIRQVQDVAPDYRKWLSSAEWQNDAERRSVKEQRMGAVKQRFLALGYEEADLNWMQYNTEMRNACSSKDITDKVWTNLRPRVEPKVIERKKNRLFALKYSVMQSRMAILTEQWELWKAALGVPTAELFSYPQDHHLWHLAAVTPLLEADESIAITATDFQPIIDDFPNIVATFISERKASLRALIPAANLSDDSPDPLDLATSILSCKACSVTYHTPDLEDDAVLSGWKMLKTHHCTQQYHRLGTYITGAQGYNFIPHLSEVASALINLCKLDPFTATVDDMDEKDERFVCGTCCVSPQLAFSVFTWRGAIAHYYYDHNQGEYGRDAKLAAIDFKVLEDDNHRREVKQKEHTRSVEYEEIAWYCNHCTRFKYRASATLYNVRQHVKDVHQIEEPCAPEDYFFNEGYRRNFEQPVIIPHAAGGS